MLVSSSKIAVFDIDGVLANKPKIVNDSYYTYEILSQRPLNQIVYRKALHLIEEGYTLYFITGRYGRDASLFFLHNHFGHIIKDILLFTRLEEDHTIRHIYKLCYIHICIDYMLSTTNGDCNFIYYDDGLYCFDKLKDSILIINNERLKCDFYLVQDNINIKKI